MTPALHIDSQGAGRPLVLLHGWAMHSGVWGPLPAQLAARFRVHAVDLPGHGKSKATVPWTLDSVLAAIRASLDEREPLTLVGWSLGAMLALHWACTDATRVERLVLVSASPRFVAGDGWPHAMAAETLARFGDELRASYRLTIVRFLTLQLAGTDEGRAALALLRRRFFERAQPSSTVLREALAMLVAIDLRDAVPRITQPALLIAGDRDMLVPLAAGEWLAAALPNARFAPITGAAHVPFLSHPAAFADALGDFLSHE